MTVLQCGNPCRGQRDAAGDGPAARRNRGPGLYRNHRGRLPAGCSARGILHGLLTIFCRHTSASLTDPGERRPGRAARPADRPRPARAAGCRLCAHAEGAGRHAGPYPHHADRQFRSASRSSTARWCSAPGRGSICSSTGDRPQCARSGVPPHRRRDACRQRRSACDAQ